MKMVMLMIMIIFTRAPAPNAWCWDIKQVYSPTSYCTSASQLFLGDWFCHCDLRIKWCIECFCWCGQQLCKFIGTKESVYKRKGFNPHSFIVLGHQYVCHDVIWKCSINLHAILLGFLCVNYLSYLLKLSNENYLNPTSYEVIFFSHHTSILYQKA